MNNKIGKIVVAIILIVIISCVVYFGIKYGTTQNLPKEGSITNSNIHIVTSLEDEISDNTAWCGTFNLIWNDLKNDLVKQDIVFALQLKMVENLNKGTFNTSHISEDSYYKVYGHPNKILKEEIEKAIKEKFNETSDILDNFEWEDRNSDDYFLYAMLKKEFKFQCVFTELENGTFGKYNNVKYFGINTDTDEQVRNQVIVLYYNSKEDFAIKLLTKSNDEVIIAKGNNSNTFGEMYDNIRQRTKEYNGSPSFSKKDILKIPNISFDLKKEFEELENKPFRFSSGAEYFIDKALQTIKFNLDKEGGKIKSEAGMSTKLAGIIPSETREFLVDDTFTIFLKEKDKDLPYFASKISDISQVQNEIQENERIVMVNGKLYYDTGRTSNELRCGMMDGNITSNVNSGEIPTENNQANFEGNYGYQYGKENAIEVNIDDKWYVFETNE